MSQADVSYTGDVFDVHSISTLVEPGPYKRLWQPFIAQWADKHLLVAFGAELNGKVDMGDIVCSVSINDGDTWAEPVMVFDHRVPLGPTRVAYANPVLYRPPKQDVVWCFAMRCPLYYRDSEDSQLCAAFSADGGWSWHPAELAVHYHSPLITNAGIVRLQDDERVRYLLPVHRNTIRHDPKGRQDQIVLESTNLLEWRLAGYIPQPEGQKVFMHEGNVDFVAGESELQIVMRTAQYGGGGKPLDPPTAYSSVSRDGGRTWSPGVPEPDLYNAVSKAYFGRAGDGTHVYVYSVGPAWERKGMAYKVKPPGGTWSEERVFYDANVRNSYPTLLECAPGQFCAVWDSSNSPDRKRTAIRFGRFSIH
jgi:hypothetical protein